MRRRRHSSESRLILPPATLPPKPWRYGSPADSRRPPKTGLSRARAAMRCGEARPFEPFRVVQCALPDATQGAIATSKYTPLVSAAVHRGSMTIDELAG